MFVKYCTLRSEDCCNILTSRTQNSARRPAQATRIGFGMAIMRSNPGWVYHVREILYHTTCAIDERLPAIPAAVANRRAGRHRAPHGLDTGGHGAGRCAGAGRVRQYDGIRTAESSLAGTPARELAASTAARRAPGARSACGDDGTTARAGVAGQGVA